MNAVAGMSLLGGSNSLYGLNTLGGSIVLRMKNGFTHPGHSVGIEGGSYHRFIANFESGGNNGEFAYYVNAQRFYEEGWRDLSNSWSENVYAGFDWRGDAGALGINYHRAMSDLAGNGLLPYGLLDQDRGIIFTAPDITDNDVSMWVVSGDYTFGDGATLSGNLYYRDNDTGSFNGDALEEDDVSELIDNGFGGEGGLRNALRGECRDAVERAMNEGDNFGEAVGGSGCGAVNNLSSRGQESLGGVFEIDVPLDGFGLVHDLSAGVGYYEGCSGFDSRVQFALFDPDTRSTRGPQSASGEFSDDRTDIDTRVERTYVYVGDSISIGDDWVITLSGFFHDREIKLRDRTDEQPQLNGEHDYDNFNWGAGGVYRWNPQFDVYASYSESSRLPTPIELACSERLARNPETDEVEECRLPNAFLADPPLDEVVAKSFELGVRGETLNGWSWSLGAFHTRNKDDIIWQTGQTRAHGLFRNVDETRRRGIEASLAGAYEKWGWNLSHTYVEATFEDDFEVLSPNHPLNDEEGGMMTRSVEKGDDIPGIPDHLFKAAVDYAFTDRFSLGFDMIAVSGSHLRGDESNELDELSGYAVFNARELQDCKL